jgi:hypothetical protein
MTQTHLSRKMAPFALIVFLWTIINKAQCEELAIYRKPVPSNGACIERIEELTATLEGESDSEINKCFGCTAFAKDECSFGCQDIIDSIYDACEGITLPRYYFYDPPVSSRFKFIQDMRF